MILAGLAFFVAGVVKGATGLGYSTSALPLLTIAMGLHAAMPLVLFPSMASNITLMFGAGHFGESLRRFLPLYIALLPGLALGLALLIWVDQNIAAGVLGMVIVAYSAIAIRRPAIRIPDRLERPLQVPIGILNGMINGLTGSQIMPLVPFMLSLNLDADRFVQAINIGFTLSSLVMVAGLSHAGFLSWNTLLVSVAGVAPAVLGSWVGRILRRRLSEVKFRRLVLGALVVLGAVLASQIFDR